METCNIVEQHDDYPIFKLLEDKIMFSVVCKDVHVKFAETREECERWIENS